MPTDRYVQLPALKLHYLDWGGSDTPIVCLHGLASTCHMFDLVAPQLTSAGHVIALDQRGHGLSDKLDDGYDFNTITSDVAQFMDALGLTQPAIVMGHSWGGGVTTCFASRFPERVKAIVLIDGGFGDMQRAFPTWEQAEALLKPPPLVNLTWNDIRKGIKERWLAAAWSPEVEQAALNVFGEDEHGFVQRRLSLDNHMRIAKALWGFTSSDHLSKIRCPILMVVPLQALTPENEARQTRKREQVETLARQMPNVQVAWFEDTIHDVPWHKPRELVEVLVKFIREL
jgi:pimeloyl-ACP methyl ester carboxylesterase